MLLMKARGLLRGAGAALQHPFLCRAPRGNESECARAEDVHVPPSFRAKTTIVATENGELWKMGPGPNQVSVWVGDCLARADSKGIATRFHVRWEERQRFLECKEQLSSSQ